MRRNLVCLLISMVTMSMNAGQSFASSSGASAAVAARSSGDNGLRHAISMNLNASGVKHAMPGLGSAVSVDERAALYKKAVRSVPSKWYIFLRLAVMPGDKIWLHARVEELKALISDDPKLKEVWGFGKYLENMIQVVQFAQKHSNMTSVWASKIAIANDKGTKSVKDIEAMLSRTLGIYGHLVNSLKQYHCLCKKCEKSFVCIEGAYDDESRGIICSACHKKSGIFL